MQRKSAVCWGRHSMTLEGTWFNSTSVNKAKQQKRYSSCTARTSYVVLQEMAWVLERDWLSIKPMADVHIAYLYIIEDDVSKCLVNPDIVQGFLVILQGWGTQGQGFQKVVLGHFKLTHTMVQRGEAMECHAFI